MRKFTFLLMLGCSTVAMAQNQISLPIDWEGTTTNYTVTDFGDNVSTRVVDPTDPNNMVLKTDKPVTAPLWAGTTLSTTAGLATAIPFAQGATVITARVWSPDAGIEVRMKAEDKTDPTKSVETSTLTTVANGWQTMTFDFSVQSTGTAPINFATTYDLLSIFYNFGVDGATAGLKTYYCDDIQFGGTSMVKNVTFRVDMRGFSGTYTTPELNGTFNNWCGNCTPMADPDNDSIWEVTVPVSGTIEYKFSADNWAVQEMLDPTTTAGCTQTTGAFTNRILAVSADTTLPAVCWESCAVCSGISTNDNWITNFSVSPNPSNGVFVLSGDLLGARDVNVLVTNLQGKIVYQSNIRTQALNETIDLSQMGNGMYILNISSELGATTQKLVVNN
jgi:hypothetical protein